MTDAVVEILMDSTDESLAFEDKIMEHSSITTSIQSLAEYKASCVKVCTAFIYKNFHFFFVRIK